MPSLATLDRPGAAIARAQQFELAQQAIGFVTWVWETGRDSAEYFGDVAPLLGLPPGSYPGPFSAYLEALHPDDVEASRRTLVDCMKGRLTEYRTQERVIWPDGAVHWLETTGRGEYRNGRCVRMMGMVRDVTAQKAQEAALIRSEEKFHRAFAACPDYMAISRVSDGRLIAVNPAFERATGYAADEAIGRSTAELGLWVNPADRDRFFAEMRTNGRTSRLGADFCTRDGNIIPAIISSATTDLDGEPVMISIVRDLTDLDRAIRRSELSERKFIAAFDTCPEPMAITRARDGRIVEINAAWLQLTGRTHAEVVGRTSSELTLWDDPSDRAALLDAMERDGSATNYPARFRLHGGHVADALLSGRCLDLESERCIVWSWRDISELRRVERSLVESERKYRSLFDYAQDCILVIAPDGTLVDVNSVGCRCLGYGREELVGLGFRRILDAHALSRLLPRAAGLTQERRRVRDECVLQRKDGSTVAVEFVAGPLPDGNILAVVRDITERKRSEQLVMNIARGVSTETGDAFFRTIVTRLATELGADYALLGELPHAGATRIRALAIHGNGGILPNHEYDLAGTPCADTIRTQGTVIVAEGVAVRYPQDLQLNQAGVSGYVGRALQSASGQTLGVLLVMSRKPIRQSVFWSGMLEIFAARAAAEIERARAYDRLRELNQSLEERVRGRTAELESLNRELEAFSLSVSHDLRGPARAIDGFAAMLREDAGGELSPVALRHLDRIQLSAKRMGRIIDALLEFGRAARGTPDRAVVDMRALVEDVLHDLGGREPLRAQVVVKGLPAATGDAALLRQVWQNLIGNALKFSGKVAAPRIEIGALPLRSGTEYYVRDNGAGFDPKYAGKLFGVFQRLHGESQFPGTGIGLALCKRIVERHGGAIGAESEPGLGASFRFSLPL